MPSSLPPNRTIQHITVQTDDGRLVLAEACLPPVIRHFSIRAARRERVRRRVRQVALLPPGPWVEVRWSGKTRWVPQHRCYGLMLEQLELEFP